MQLQKLLNCNSFRIDDSVGLEHVAVHLGCGKSTWWRTDGLPGCGVPYSPGKPGLLGGFDCWLGWPTLGGKWTSDLKTVMLNFWECFFPWEQREKQAHAFPFGGAAQLESVHCVSPACDGFVFCFANFGSIERSLQHRKKTSYSCEYVQIYLKCGARRASLLWGKPGALFLPRR